MSDRGTPRLVLLCLCAIAAPMACMPMSCAGGGHTGGNGSLPGGALNPERLAIHPLTRIGVDAAANPVIVCHFELRDAYAQPVRALGIARVELFRPGSEFADGSQIQDLVWRTDLSSPEENARHYDGLVTRTYTLSLGGLPRWLLEWRDGEGGVGTVSPTIRVSFFTGRESAESELSDVFRLSR